MVPYKAIDIETPANGRLGQTVVYVLGEEGQVLFTDKGDLTSAAERRRMGKRIAQRFAADEQKVAVDLERAWNDSANQYQAVRAQATGPSPEGQPSGAPSGAPAATDPLAATPPPAASCSWRGPCRGGGPGPGPGGAACPGRTTAPRRWRCWSAARPSRCRAGRC